MTSITDRIEQNLEEVRGIESVPFQNTEEWHEARLKKFTASRAGDMMKRGRKKEDAFGIPALNYIHEKLAEILTNQPHIIESRATSWGHDMEDQAIEAYEELTGNKVDRVGFVEWNEYSGGSPDGLVGSKGMIEVKCPYNSANHVSVMLSEELPENHYWQVQFNLMVTERQWCDYISFDPRVQEDSLRVVIISVERNEDSIKAIQDRLIEVKEKLDELLNKCNAE